MMADGSDLAIRTLRAKEACEVTLEDVLARLLHPVGVDEFMRAHWRQTALALVPRPNDPRAAAAASARFERVREALFDLDLDALLENTASERIFAWMPAREPGAAHDAPSRAPAGAAGADTHAAGAPPLRSFELDDARSARVCHECGASLYMRAPQEFCEAWVSALAEQLGLGAGARHPSGELRGEVELFASRAGHSTGWHFDFQENFTLQLRGKKTWVVHRGGVEHPVRGATPHYRAAGNLEQQLRAHRLQAAGFSLAEGARAEAAGRVRRVTLVPGSVLYFPAGAWHRVECEEDSLSVNLSLLGLSWAELLADAARQRAWAVPALRATACVPPLATPSARRDAARAQCAEALRALRAQLDALREEDMIPDSYTCAPPPAGYVDVMAERERLAPPLGPSQPAANAPRAPGAPSAKRARAGGGGRGEPTAGAVRCNPLCVIVKDEDALGELRDTLLAQAAEAEAEAEASEGEGASSDGSGAAGAGGKGEPSALGGSDDADGEEEGSADQSDAKEEEPTLYALSVNFGGEDLAPHARALLGVPSALEPLLDWLARTALERVAANAACALIGVREAEEEGTRTGITREAVHQLLRVLCFHGFGAAGAS